MENLESLLVKGINKNDIAALAQAAGTDEHMFLHLLDVIENGAQTPAMKAAWVIGTMSDQGALELIDKYAERIYQLATEKPVGGVVRELMKALIAANLSENLQGRFLDFCFKQLMRMDVDVALKYNSNKYILKSLKQYPELKDEFLTILESQLDSHNDAWKKYTSRIIAQLRK